MSQVLRDGKPIRRRDVWVRETNGEIAIIDHITESVHLVNDTALAIWNLCDGDTRPDEMISAICEVSGLHSDVVTEDVERILMEFEQAALIVWRPIQEKSSRAGHKA